MYSGFKAFVIRVLKVPPEPDPPAGDQLEVFRAAPAWFQYRRIVWLLATFMLGGMFAAIEGVILLASIDADATSTALLYAGGAILAALFVFQTVVRYATLRLDYEMRWYMVTDRSLRIREGVLGLREMTLTFANIQEIAIHQGPIQRIFGVKDVMVRTAGGGAAASAGQHSFHMHIGYFRGVANAEAIRDLVRRRLEAYRDAGLGDTDDDHTETTTSLVAALGELAEETRALREAVG